MHQIRTLLSGFTLLLFCAEPVLSTTGGVTDVPEMSDDLEVSNRKRPSFWHRADKKTATEQLAWARQLRTAGKMSAARKQFNALVHKWHNSTEAPAAQMAYAEMLEEKGKHAKAFDEFQYLVDYFSGRFKYETVMDHQFRIANQIMTTRRMRILGLPGFDMSYAARPLFTKVVENAPNWSKTPQAQFHVGLIYEKEKDYEEAITAYELIQLRYRDSAYATEATYRRAVCLYKAANVQRRDERSSQIALSALSRFIRDHGDNPNARQAQAHLDDLHARLAKMYYERALFYDKKAVKPRAALIAYTDFVKNFPASDETPAARKRIAILEKEVKDHEAD